MTTGYRTEDQGVVVCDYVPMLGEVCDYVASINDEKEYLLPV